MAEDLVSKLRSALLYHQVRLDPIPRRQCVADPDDPTLAYLSRILLGDADDDDDEPPPPPPRTLHLQDSYLKLMAELTALVSPVSPLSPELASAAAAEDCPHCRDISEKSRADSLRSMLLAEDSPHGRDISEKSGADSLRSMLLAAARAVAANRTAEAHAMAREVRARASPRGGSGERTSVFFADALIARITGYGPQVYAAMLEGVKERRAVHVRMLNLPCFRVTQRFANCNILALCDGVRRLHIVDYGIHYGCQWPQLIKLLSQRAQGPPPLIRITGVDLPRFDVAETGRKLVEFARSCGVSLDFEAVASASWESVQPRRHLDDFLVVNCNLRLRHLREDDSVSHNPRRIFFERLRGLRPDALIQCVEDASPDLSSPFFAQRFQGALDGFLARMDMFEGLLRAEMPDEYDLVGNIQAARIVNMVACEGVDRVERPNSYRSWDARARRAGFELRPLRSQTVELIMKVCCSSAHNANFENLRLGVDGDWLLLGWKDSVFHAMSTWSLKSQVAKGGYHLL